MNSPARKTYLLPILLILLFACQPEEDQIMVDNTDQQEIENFISDAEEVFLDPNQMGRMAVDKEPCGEMVSIPLKVYRNKVAGNISITNSPDMLLVQFASNPEYSLYKTMLVLMIEDKRSSTKRWFYGKYRKLILPVVHEMGTQEFIYKIPYADLELEGNECISLIAFAFLNTSENMDYRRKAFALAKPENNNHRGIFKRFFIDYCLQACAEQKAVDDISCQIECNFGFGIPSVEIANSYSFKDLGIEDWTWGYVHEIKNETLFRLPIKKDDNESAAIIGQVTVMIQNDIAYIYFQMNDGYPMNKTSVYFSHAQPESGIPCNYTYNRTYTNTDGTWKPTLTDTYLIENVSDILSKSTNNDKALYLITYTDFCE